MSVARILLFAAAVFAATTVGAQSYATRTVRIIVPTTPGAVDQMARYLCDKLPQSLGQPCVVENKPGAATIIGLDYVAKAEPDGHTLLVAPNTLPTLPALYARLPFDPIRDLAPVALVSRTPMMLGANAAFPPKTFREFITYVKANPGKVNFTSCGVGTTQHLAGEALKMMAGIEMAHVPYKGCGPAEADVLGGHIPVIISNTARFMPQIRAGKLTGYALAGASRTPFAPGYPTIAESGFPGFDFDIWFGLMAPGRTPKEIIAVLNAEVNRIVSLPDIREKLLAQSYEPIGGTSEQFAGLIRADIDRYARVIREAGIKVE